MAAFLQIALNDYVDDPDHLDADITWSFAGNTDLTLQYKFNRQLLRVFAPGGWVGSETITFTATDPDGLSDSDDAILSVTAEGTMALTSNSGQSSDLMSAFNEANAVPEQFELFQNYPNPFNPETQIRYALKEAAWVTVKIYNTLGQAVTTLVDSHQSAGFKSVHWDGRDQQGRAVSSGIYIYEIQAGEFNQVRKMVFSK